MKVTPLERYFMQEGTYCGCCYKRKLQLFLGVIVCVVCDAVGGWERIYQGDNPPA